MQLIKDESLNKLVPTEHKYLIAKEDVEKPVDERYYFEFAYVPEIITLEQCEEKFIEIDKED